MPTRNTSLISPDDFSTDQPMMVLRRRRKQVMFDSHRQHPLEIDDPLCGVVLEVKAMNFPFVLTIATCPVRGQQSLIVDIRKYVFIRVDREFANEVIAAVQVADDSPEIPNDDEEICNLFSDEL